MLALLLAGCAAGGPAGNGGTRPAGSTNAITGSTSAGPATSPTVPSMNTTGRPSTARPSTTHAATTSPGSPSPSTSPRTSAAPTPPAQQLRVGHDAWVAVSVATLWRLPSSPRPVDRPALDNPARIRTWLAAMTDSDRRGLSGRADTQALLGDRVRVVARSGSWVKVVVPSQPTPSDSRGYPGWVPAVQLTAVAPGSSTRDGTVVSPTAWLHTDSTAATRIVEVSFGTRLPVLSVVGSFVRVGLPGGRVARLRLADVSVTGAGGVALPTSGAARVASAMAFTGLPYLWAGTSGFGFDCSGLTYLVLRVHGATIPRDAVPQSRGGTAVAATALRPGDLLFYARYGVVHHVTMYAGDGRMVQAPRTGGVVEAIPLATLADEFSGARRY